MSLRALCHVDSVESATVPYPISVTGAYKIVGHWLHVAFALAAPCSACKLTLTTCHKGTRTKTSLFALLVFLLLLFKVTTQHHTLHTHPLPLSTLQQPTLYLLC